jgi:hypothetical protein
MGVRLITGRLRACFLAGLGLLLICGPAALPARGTVTGKCVTGGQWRARPGEDK